MNGDGYPDLVSGTVSIAYGTASGKFLPSLQYAINNNSPTFNVALADLRNNGRLDILIDNQDSVSVLLNAGKGGYEDGIPVKIAGGAGCGASADFNGDGRPDLAVNDLNRPASPSCWEPATQRRHSPGEKQSEPAASVASLPQM